jgi:transposase
MGLYVGLDVSKQDTAICVRDDLGRIVWLGKTATDPDRIVGVLGKLGQSPDRVVLETGRTSNWLHNALRIRGLPVVCVDARQAHAVLNQMHNKTDANDAALLSELARTGFYRQVTVKRLEAQEQRTLLKARELVIQQRVDLDNTIRGFLASFGVQLPKEPRRFADRVRLAIEGVASLKQIIDPLLALRASVRAAIGELDGRLRRVARDLADCRRLMTVPGVGAVTAFAFLATIDDPARFARSRSVGAYFGLTSRRYQSGERDSSGRISRRGDQTMRTLLYEAASALITRTNPASGAHLQAWARALRSRVGHKKAAVALARKLAVLLHRIWINGTFFMPRSDAEAGA